MDLDQYLDEESLRILNERIQQIKDIKPEMLSRDGETDEYGFYKSSTSEMFLSDPIFPR